MDSAEASGVEVLRSVYARFSAADPELDNGFAEHVPMGAEALLTLGVSPSMVLAWSERHSPTDATGNPRWREARDEIARSIDTHGWEHAVRSYVARLVDHLDAHLFHGLIRTAHAVRSIRAIDAPETRAELASALAAWETWAPSADPPTGSGASPATATLLDPIEAATRGAHTFLLRPTIIALHAVTGPMAFDLVSDMVDEEGRVRAAAVFGRTHAHHPAAEEFEPSVWPFGPSECARLVAQWDAHPAKLFEAAHRAHARTGNPVFVAATTKFAT